MDNCGQVGAHDHTCIMVRALREMKHCHQEQNGRCKDGATMLPAFRRQYYLRSSKSN